MGADGEGGGDDEVKHQAIVTWTQEEGREPEDIDVALDATADAIEAGRVLGNVAVFLVRRPQQDPKPEPAAPKAAIDDRLMTAEEAATFVGLTVKQLQRRRLPFRKKLGHRTVLYSERGIRRWLAR